MHLSFITTQPKLIKGFLSEALIARATKQELISSHVYSLYDFCEGSERPDDKPYGGGPGMILRCEPIEKALKQAERDYGLGHRVLLAASGATFNQQKAVELAANQNHLVFICGRYEGVDQRVVDNLCDATLSIGDYVMMGGEVASMAITESVVRLLPGVLGNSESVLNESFSKPEWREYPQYTRPSEYKGWKVPSPLTSGNHSAIAKWRSDRSF